MAPRSSLSALDSPLRRLPRHAYMFVALALGLSGAAVSCSDSDGGDDGATAGYGADQGTDFAPGSGTGGGGIGDGGANGDGQGDGSSGDLSGDGNDGSGLGRAGFRFGVNLGHPNPEFDDSEMSDLASTVGVKSIRLKYPEYHFKNWGQAIEVGDAEHYASLGMKNHVAFLIGMTQEHSTAPSGSADWERDYYIPKNLYESIFLENGEINPENYYAVYFAATFETYKPWVKYWEIFNEPDWVEDWQVTQAWDTEPPTAEQLVRFHGSIFDYVRMLRIASAIRDAVAPDTYILTGGLGYPSFVNALLRYTDNPDGGKVTDRYPETGAAYFDVLSIHHYPHLVEDGGSDDALGSLIHARDAFQAELSAAGAADKGWMVTESGAAHEQISGVASGAEYARNYLQKSMIWAKAEGVLGVDWFTLSDGNSGSDAFQRMGLYEPVGALAETSDAVATTTGAAYLAMSNLLAEARLDIDATQALALPDGARGYVFQSPNNTVTVLWASSNEEDANLSVSIPSEVPVRIHSWDGASGDSLTPTGGKVSLTLPASPVFLTNAQ